MTTADDQATRVAAAEVVAAWRKLRPYQPDMPAFLVRALDTLSSCYPSEIDQVFAGLADEAARQFEIDDPGAAA